MRFIPTSPPAGLDPTLQQYLQQELERIADCMSATHDLDVLDALPAKPREGMIRYFSTAAGLGAAGAYQYTAGAWTAL